MAGIMDWLQSVAANPVSPGPVIAPSIANLGNTIDARGIARDVRNQGGLLTSLVSGTMRYASRTRAPEGTYVPDPGPNPYTFGPEGPSVSTDYGPGEYERWKRTAELSGPHGLLRQYMQRDPDSEYLGLLPLAKGPDGWRLALSDFLRGSAEATVNSLALPAEAESGLLSKDEINARAMETASALMVGGAMLPAPKDSLRIFAGRNAKTADLGALERAQQMAANGLDRDAIWAETGWFKGVDGQWRFEIPDDEAYLAPGRIPGAERIEHDELAAAYPEMMASLQQVVREAPVPSIAPALGQYNPATNTLIATGPNRLPTGLHELQHGVQTKEGFAPGTNFRSIDPMAIEYRAMDLLGKENQTGTPIPWADLPDARKQELRIAAARQLYKETAGEVEARNVQTRANMTPEERRATPPWDTQDVPDFSQRVAPSRPGPAASYPADAPLRAPELPAATAPKPMAVPTVTPDMIAAYLAGAK